MVRVLNHILPDLTIHQNEKIPYVEPKQKNDVADMQKSKKSNLGQSWFPKSWTDKDIRRAGEHVAGLKGNRRIPDGKTIYGVYKGVRVGVKRTHGKIATVFPDSDQSSVTRRKHK